MVLKSVLEFFINIGGARSNERAAQLMVIDSVQKMIEIDGANLSVDVWDGDGETNIALPCLGSDTSYYRLIAPKIAASGYRFIAVNPRGIRGSEGATDDLTQDILASDVANIIKVLELNKAHLIGWAYGNRIARTTAANHPDTVVLTDSIFA